MAIDVTRTRHGPFERIVLRAEVPSGPAVVSAWRVGDALVDTGSSLVAGALVDALRADPPRRIVCTHQHEDHVGGVAAIRRAFGAIPVHAPRPHVPVIARTSRVPAYRAAVWGDPEAFDDAIAYDPGATFDAGGVTLEAIATPGHTPGHCAIVAKVGGEVLACTGDLYVTASPLVAWFESAADDAVRSCRALAAHGGALRMLPAHGRARDDGAAALTTMADNVEREATRVLDAAARLGTRDLGPLVAELWGDEPSFMKTSGGEFSRACFVRSVLDPVRALPASVPKIG